MIFFCSEAIVSSIKNNFEIDMPDEMIAMASGEHKEQCISFTGEVAEKAAQIIIRELKLVNIEE